MPQLFNSNTASCTLGVCYTLLAPAGQCQSASLSPQRAPPNQRQVLGQVGRDLHVSQQHLPRWPWLAKQRFFGVVFEKQWTSLALPATGLQFLAGNGPFLALSQTRPAAAPHLQNPNGPPCQWAGGAPKRANHQPIWPPVHGKASWGLATPNAGHLVWPPNLAC